MGIKLPNLQIGRFLRTEVAPLIPGGEKAAEGINSIIKTVKGKTSAGASVVPATQEAIRQVNVEEQKRQMMTWLLVGGAVIVVILFVRGK